MRRYLTERLRDHGGNRAPVFYTTHTPSRPGRQGWQRRGLGRQRPVVLRRRVPRGVNAALVVGVVVAVGQKGGGARRLAELLAGVWSTMIEAGRYRAGWTRLSAGRRKRRAATLAVETRMGSRGRGASSGAADDGDGRGPDDRSVDATLSRFGGGMGSLLPHPVNCRGPVDGNGSDRGE